ncbi:hypothetical protein ABZ793_27625 [Micromonospora sp. NPDC047465]|uniref:hypothetical protein n=1 Tax=Micromonospora sp. NPDC047465 TaxID=3154813 RepID=UPI0033D09E70
MDASPDIDTEAGVPPAAAPPRVGLTGAEPPAAAPVDAAPVDVAPVGVAPVGVAPVDRSPGRRAARLVTEVLAPSVLVTVMPLVVAARATGSLGGVLRWGGTALARETSPGRPLGGCGTRRPRTPARCTRPSAPAARCTRRTVHPPRGCSRPSAPVSVIPSVQVCPPPEGRPDPATVAAWESRPVG